jgi:hypothetical protein
MLLYRILSIRCNLYGLQNDIGIDRQNIKLFELRYVAVHGLEIEQDSIYHAYKKTGSILRLLSNVWYANLQILLRGLVLFEFA